MTTRRIVILGNGGAACHAVQAVREAGFRGEIVMVSDLREPAFNPMLAPYYLKGLMDWERCYPFGADFYRRHEVTCRFGSPVCGARCLGTHGSCRGWFPVRLRPVCGGNRRQCRATARPWVAGITLCLSFEDIGEHSESAKCHGLGPKSRHSRGVAGGH